MSNQEEMNLFLEYIKKMYIQNPNFEVEYDTIYHELRLFNSNNGIQERITPDSVLNIQYQLSRKFSGTKGRVFSDGYFFAFENRGVNQNYDKSFYDKISNGIKLYISCDIKKLYNVAKSLFNFMLKENIITQSKIAKEMRNDVLVVRVSTPEEAIKVKNHIASLKYKTTVKANPFALRLGNTSMTWDCGSISYNVIVSKFIKNYFDDKRKKKNFDKVNSDDFAKFVRKEIFMCSQNQHYLFHRYQSDREPEGFFKIASIIADNAEGILTEEKLFAYQKVTTQDLKEENILTEDKKDKLLYVIYKLSNYYSIDNVHKILECYAETGREDVFTRRDSIRNIIIDNFPPKTLKKLITEMGTRYFYECIQLTSEKYNQEQVTYAIAKFMLNNELDAFTRDYESRNKLGLVVPREWFSDIIKSELGPEREILIDKLKKLSSEEKTKILNQIQSIVLSGVNSVNVDDLTGDILVLSSYICSNVMDKIKETGLKKTGIK